MNHCQQISCALVLAGMSLGAYGVDTAPRISDREIIESLARLEAGQKALAEQTDQRFKAMEAGIDHRFAAVDQRFAAIEKRLDDQMLVMLSMFSALILLIVALFGYIVWDRRTALRPLEARLAELEQDLERDLQLRHEQGSLPTRLLNVLRQLAREDEKLAGVLRSFSML
ncbi:hypothetical protein [Thiorhodovibrio frisius]|uniref:Uncharacterized protein n=1 Tax=Thiorhodovibrio frisius TaxID=631362 RepID=H8Z5C5_9GAMM|nr:hypothetical protein [Thiorhodovibrio frisius]EIC20532.1 hypothetical protein Thi970DRAFT_04174 [Thiorhodovibrio frisius]WPL21278.1 hypothetical protein Thiofri_01390 [Thiorhodovibrio frisius]